jgi:hypothetical protein
MTQDLLEIDYWVGVDPGVNTGLAVWMPDAKAFKEIETLKIHRALLKVQQLIGLGKTLAFVVENPNTYIPFASQSAEVLAAKKQGAGSVKRDFSIWRDFVAQECPKALFIPQKLQGSLKKTSSGFFATATGWRKKTDVHGRDAAMLVFGR